MIGKLVVLVAVLAALWTIPAARERMAGAALPLLERMGPTGERLMAPAHRWAARHDLDEVLTGMKQDALEGRRPPDPQAFAAYARRQLEKPAVDPWGQAYWLERAGRTVTVGSNGPDGERGSADDITKSAAF